MRDFCPATQDIHTYADSDWVVGTDLLDVFRTPQKANYAAQEASQPVYLLLRTSERNIYGQEKVGPTAKPGRRTWRLQGQPGNGCIKEASV